MQYQPLQVPVTPWLGNVIPSLSSSVGIELGEPAPFHFETNESVILIVVDGLGWNPLQARKGHAEVLRSYFDQTIVTNTCLPSTTAAALTALCTGSHPGQTNMVGYSVGYSSKSKQSGVTEVDSTMNLLHFYEGIDPEVWQPQLTYFEKIRATSSVRPIVISTPKFSTSGLTRAALRGADFFGATSLESRFELAHRLAEEQPSFIYLYWSEIDHAGHKYGVESQEWTAELELFDAALGTFLATCPQRTNVVLTADHGMVEVGKRIDIAEIPQLSTDVRLLAGEGRAVHVHALPGREDEVRARWSQELGEQAVILGPEQYSQVLGEGPGNSLLGAALVLLRDRTVIVDSRQQSPGMIGQRGVHGSFSDMEMQVPVMTLR